MNADLQGILNYYGNRPIKDLLMSDNGYMLSANEARAYIKYCLSQGHTELKTCPDFDEVKEKLKL